MKEEKTITNIAFSDESYWNQGRFRSIGMITLKASDLEVVDNYLNKLLQDSGVLEFKWEKVRSARDRMAAEKLCKSAIELAATGKIRIDVLRWDIEDSRHKIEGRDDTANLQRMYYHLFKYVLSERWLDGCIWKLCPDEQTGINWSDIHEFLTNVSTETEVLNNTISP